MNNPELPTASHDANDKDVGSVFVSNYPPFSAWSPDSTPEIGKALQQSAVPGNDFGLYLHIPFCRKRCKFCYFRVFTDKNSDEIGAYVDALAREVELYSERPAIAGRCPKFIYFGGGTPSYISVEHLRRLVARLQAAIPWTGAEEITFECEPGTLTRSKLEAVHDLGVTRLSLGIESFDDEILQTNGRAHVSAEIFRCLPWIEKLGFAQLNIDLIAGMVGETWSTWRETVAKTVDLQPDSVTIYQLELPYNTRFSQRILDGRFESPLADWETKRGWHDYAFNKLAKAGYELSSAYTMVKNRHDCRFVYRDAVWHGCDLLGAGVASFSHVNRVHFQNVDSWGEYLALLAADQLPWGRARRTSSRERLTREMILQLKLGQVDPEYFQQKFEISILDEFGGAFQRLVDAGMMETDEGAITLTRRGLLQVDSLLPEFYEPHYLGTRYT